ncbi:amino acid transporter, partial [Xanthomonas vasicola pv. musacearum NCPPB 4384]
MLKIKNNDVHVTAIALVVNRNAYRLFIASRRFVCGARAPQIRTFDQTDAVLDAFLARFVRAAFNPKATDLRA